MDLWHLANTTASVAPSVTTKKKMNGFEPVRLLLRFMVMEYRKIIFRLTFNIVEVSRFSEEFIGFSGAFASCGASAYFSTSVKVRNGNRERSTVSVL